MKNWKFWVLSFTTAIFITGAVALGAHILPFFKEKTVYDSLNSTVSIDRTRRSKINNVNLNAGIGSAVCIGRSSNSAILLTAGHVVEDPTNFILDTFFEPIETAIRSNRVTGNLPIRTIAINRELDIAFIKIIGPNTLSPAKFSTRGEVPILSQLLLTGNPTGLPDRIMIGWASRTIRTNDIITMQEVQAPAQGGMSGGGVFLTSDMNLAGIITQVRHNHEGHHFYTYFVPVNTIRNWLRTI